VAAPPTEAFALAVLAGAAAWVVAATGARLPVSTTHAIVGALIGAGLLLAPTAVQWHALLPRVVIPLLASSALAYAASAVINRLTRSAPECICVDLAQPIVVHPSPTAAATVKLAGRRRDDGNAGGLPRARDRVNALSAGYQQRTLGEQRRDQLRPWT